MNIAPARRYNPVFKDHLQFDIPISLFPFLFHRLEKSTKYLLRKMHLCGETPQKAMITLFCQEDQESHTLEIELNAQDSFHQNLMTMESALLKLDLSNPICSIDLVFISAKRKTTSSIIKQRISKLMGSHLTTGQQQIKKHQTHSSLEPLDEGEVSSLDSTQLNEYNFLSRKPVKTTPFEWQESRGRDYYLAIDSLGHRVWIFFDHLENGYFKIEDCA